MHSHFSHKAASGAAFTPCGSSDHRESLLFSSGDLRRLIIPLIFEQALAMTVGIADTVMISAVGEAAVSGVSLVDMINNLVFAVFSALATGGAVVTSQYIGAKRPRQARDSAAQLLITVLTLGLFVMLLTIAVKEPLLRLFFGGIEEDVMQNALIYFLISALSFPFLAVYNACADSPAAPSKARPGNLPEALSGKAEVVRHQQDSLHRNPEWNRERDLPARANPRCLHHCPVRYLTDRCKRRCQQSGLRRCHHRAGNQPCHDHGHRPMRWCRLGMADPVLSEENSSDHLSALVCS